MALGYSIKVQPTVFGNYRVSFATITLDNNYLTGGYALIAGNLGLSSITWLDTSFPGAEFVQATLKLRMRTLADQHTHNILATGGQAPGVPLQVAPDSASGLIGKTTAGSFSLAGGVQSNSAGVVSVNTGAAEVTNGTDLSGIIISVIAIGT